ncbi:MAG: peptide chain release factor 3 [Clostridiales bacterium]|jgi:peptide chain release factor 3|nr:peptide chain release factor 3 [Clostridiales bacterium]
MASSIDLKLCQHVKGQLVKERTGTLTLLTNNDIEEINSRRTFAIISHPDAGKTTLTEKLLLLGGAIRLAGSIKGKKTQKYAASDWMEMERQRGISITSSVLQFSYSGYRINILDTPGHQDFSEDTYRTLTAADSALMVIDMAKGVEPQTVKLFEVCRRQGIPIFTFINKLDRQGKDPFDLLDELEKVLGIGSCPFNWPVRLTSGNYGLYDRRSKTMELYRGWQKGGLTPGGGQTMDEVEMRQTLGVDLYENFRKEIELLDVAGEPFDEEKVRAGTLTPLFFGSAINSFGLPSFFHEFLKLAASPAQKNSSVGLIDPHSSNFSGFIFKIQANMNPAHRDRIAFLRVCSGKFTRDMTVGHVRTGKKIRLSQPQQFLAQDRHIVEEAYPGDIIGIYDPGIYQIGDTLSQENSFEFEKPPRFSPELFSSVTTRDAMKYKQFHKGLSQLAEEGAIQVYKATNREEIILGVVGELQFEVFQYRLKSEYGVDVVMQRLPYQRARWVKQPPSSLGGFLVKDEDGNSVILYENDFALEWAIRRNPSVTFNSLEELPSSF